MTSYPENATLYYINRFTLDEGGKEEGETLILLPATTDKKVMHCSYTPDERIEERIHDEFPGTGELIEVYDYEMDEEIARRKESAIGKSFADELAKASDEYHRQQQEMRQAVEDEMRRAMGFTSRYPRYPGGE